MRVFSSNGIVRKRLNMFPKLSSSVLAVLLLSVSIGFYGCSQETPLEPNNQSEVSTGNPDLIPGQYIVVLKSTKEIANHKGLYKRLKQNITQSAFDIGVEPVRVYSSVVHGYSAKLTEGQYQLLLTDPAVDYIEPDRPVHMIAQTTPWGINAVNAPTAHARGTKGSGVKVGIIDTGIDHGHPDLAGNYVSGIDYVNGDNDPMDDNGHGSHVSGTVAAVDNSIGVIGVAPSASLYGIKVLDAAGSGTFSNVVAGIDWAAANGMDVVNMSLGASIGTSALQTACDNAYASGVVICAAAGNDYGGPVGYPAKYSSTIAVSAVDQNNNLANFSNKGPEVEVTAPGVGIVSTYKNGQYATLDGTSMATPHVAGVVALIWSTGQFTSATAVRNQLTSTATDIGAAGRDNNFGFGLVNADAATNVGPPPNQAPTANANGPYSGTTASAIAFSSAGSSDADGTIVGYSWDFGDGGTSTAANPNYTYSAGGTFNVTLTVTDDQGATGSNSTTATVTVPNTNPPTADFSGSPVSGNAPLTVSFTDLSTNGPTSWSWDFGDGGTSTAQNPSHTYSAGTYDVSMTATNANGSNTMTKVAYITSNTPPPNQAPTANANGPYSGQANSAVSFSSAGSSDPDGSIAGYSWDFGDGGTSTAANPNYTYGAAGTYNVTLTVTDDQGATGSNATTATITAAPPPPPTGEGFILSRNADFSTDDRSFTTGETMYMKMWSDQVDFTNMNRERWELKDPNKNKVRQNFTNNGDGTWTTAFALSGLPSNATSWTWKGEVKDNNGTAFKPSTNVTITQGGGGNQSPTANANGPYSGTVGNAVSFSSAGSSDPDGSIVGYSWDFGDGGTSTAANPNYTYSAAGAYTVTLTVTDDQGATGSASTSADITGGGGGNQAPTANANGPYSGTVGNGVSFSSAGSSDPDGSIVGYSWDFGDGGTSTAANPNYTYGASGNYTVTLTVTDDQGATGSATTSANITGGGGGGDNVTITKAQYDQQKQKLDIRATTDDPNAVLSVVGYGQMTFKASKNRWELKITGVNPGPSTVTVTSTSGGSDTSNVTFK